MESSGKNRPSRKKPAEPSDSKRLRFDAAHPVVVKRPYFLQRKDGPGKR